MNAITQLEPTAGQTLDPPVMSAAINACAEGLAVIESDRVLYANPAFAHMLGFLHTTEVQGRTVTDLAPGLRDLSQAGAPQVGAPQVGKPEVGKPRPNSGWAAWELTGTRKDGTPIRVETSGARFKLGGRDLWVLSVRDAGQPQLTPLQTREAQKMEAIGRLVGGVAHDFNNLVTGIVLCCDLLLTGLDRKNRLRRYAEEIRLAGVQSTALIQQLLAVARQRVVEPRLLSFNEAILGMRSLLTRLIGENIELLTELADNLDPVLIDPALVQQIILNLVLNARDAMPDGGKITLSTRNHQPPSNSAETEPQVEFSVRDTGCGMDVETRSRLFEPFFTTKQPGHGNGLGLATVHSIVKEDGGNIEVESQPGQGTRVVVRLPRAEPELSSKKMPDLEPIWPSSEQENSEQKKGEPA